MKESPRALGLGWVKDILTWVWLASINADNREAFAEPVLLFPTRLPGNVAEALKGCP